MHRQKNREKKFDNVDVGGARQKWMSPSKSTRKSTLHRFVFMVVRSKIAQNIVRALLQTSYISTSYNFVSLLVRCPDDDGPFGIEKKFFVIFGCTDLRISLSGTKCDAEADFDVRLGVAPPKPHQNSQKNDFRDQKTNLLSESFFQGWNFDSA